VYLGDCGALLAKRPQGKFADMPLSGDCWLTFFVSDHRGSNSQAIDFESVKTYPIFTAKNENHVKSNT
jgi:hypothetical protein